MKKIFRNIKEELLFVLKLLTMGGVALLCALFID